MLIGRDKAAGSAQRRTRESILQHGSIILANRFEQQPTSRVPLPFETAVRNVRSGLAEPFTRITEEPLEPGSWTKAELAKADELIPKYTGDTWTKRS